MVKIITDKAELERYINENKPWSEKSGYVTRMTLTPEKIEEFKKNGFFLYIRREIGGMHKMMFSCTDLEDDGKCSYYFVSPTEKMMLRVTDMLYKMYYDNRKVPIVKCGDSQSPGMIVSIEGTIKACNIF